MHEYFLSGLNQYNAASLVLFWDSFDLTFLGDIKLLELRNVIFFFYIMYVTCKWSSCIWVVLVGLVHPGTYFLGFWVWVYMYGLRPNYWNFMVYLYTKIISQPKNEHSTSRKLSVFCDVPGLRRTFVKLLKIILNIFLIMLSFLLWLCSHYKYLRTTFNFNIAKFEISVHHTASPWDIFPKSWNKFQISLLF